MDRSSALLTPILFNSRENAGTLLIPLLIRLRPKVAYKIISGRVNDKNVCLALSEHVGKQSCHSFSRSRVFWSLSAICSTSNAHQTASAFQRSERAFSTFRPYRQRHGRSHVAYVLISLSITSRHKHIVRYGQDCITSSTLATKDEQRVLPTRPHHASHEHGAGIFV